MCKVVTYNFYVDFTQTFFLKSLFFSLLLLLQILVGWGYLDTPLIGVSYYAILSLRS